MYSVIKLQIGNRSKSSAHPVYEFIIYFAFFLLFFLLRNYVNKKTNHILLKFGFFLLKYTFSVKKNPNTI